MANENPRAVIGGNRPPIEDHFRDIIEELPSRLDELCSDLVQRTKDLADNAANVPEVIKSDEEEAKATDIVSQMKKHQKMADSRRLGINALPRQAAAIINSFFENKAITPLDKEIARIEPGVTRYKREKAERELRAREERERLAREEADRLRREKEEAERKKREAEEAAARAKAEEERARKETERLKQEAWEAEQRRQKAEDARIEQEKLAAEAETKRKKATAERKAREAKEAEEKAERERADAMASVKAEKENIQKAKAEQAETRQDVQAASRDVRTAASMVKHADSDVAKSERASNAKLSEVSQSRGDYGSQSSLRTKWVGRLVDREKIDKKALWPFISDEHLQMAINKYVSVVKGTRPLTGATIEEESDTAFR